MWKERDQAESTGIDRNDMEWSRIEGETWRKNERPNNSNFSRSVHPTFLVAINLFNFTEIFCDSGPAPRHKMDILGLQNDTNLLIVRTKHRHVEGTNEAHMHPES